MPAFTFRLLFLTPTGRTFSGIDPDNHAQLSLPEIDQTITLHQLPHRKNHTPGCSERFVIKGTGFPTEEAARSCGERIKQALIVVGCDTKIGIDIGRDHCTSSISREAQSIASQTGIQLRNPVHGLDVYPEDLPVKHFEISATGNVFASFSDAPAKIKHQFAINVTLNDKHRLALELYNLSRFALGVPRFLTLVTIIEVLAEREKAEQPAEQQLNQFIELTKTSALTSEQCETLCNRLGDLKRESISAACRRVVANSISAEAANYFMKCYDARCILLHRGENKPAMTDNCERLDEIVREVLLNDIC
jgi:hypothetical protein